MGQYSVRKRDLLIHRNNRFRIPLRHEVSFPEPVCQRVATGMGVIRPTRGHRSSNAVRPPFGLGFTSCSLSRGFALYGLYSGSPTRVVIQLSNSTALP